MLAADGNIAGVARKALEAETGKPVVTAQNAESFRQLVTDIVTDAAQLSEKRRPQIGNKPKNSYREILGNCRPRAAYISDFDREMAKYLKGGEPN